MCKSNSSQGTESILDQLYENYDGKRKESQIIHQEFQKLDTLLASLSFEAQTEAYCICNNIAREQARLAFREGVLVGIRLGEELNPV